MTTPAILIDWINEQLEAEEHRTDVPSGRTHCNNHSESDPTLTFNDFQKPYSSLSKVDNPQQ